MKAILMVLNILVSHAPATVNMDQRLLPEKSPHAAYINLQNHAKFSQAIEPAEMFSNFIGKKMEGHYLDSPDTGHYIHSISWSLSINANLVLETKEVKELNFYMTTIFYKDEIDKCIRFIRHSNKGGTSEGVARVKDNAIHLEVLNETEQIHFRYTYTMLPDGTVCDKFYRRNSDGAWSLGHNIFYKEEN